MDPEAFHVESNLLDKNSRRFLHLTINHKALRPHDINEP
jgi:hypothetical protein